MKAAPLNEVVVAANHAAHDQLAVLTLEANDRTRNLALRLGYEGGLSVDTLENSAREVLLRMGRSVWELGAYLLLIREQAPHGEFLVSLGRLGVQPRVAQQYMQVSLRFGKYALTSHLQAVGITKLVEMLVLDDQEIAELADGGSVRDIRIDKIDTLSVKELRAALRQSEKDKEFEASKRQKAESERDAFEKKLGGNRPVMVPLDERITPFQVEITERQSLLEKCLMAHHQAVAALEAWHTQEVTSAPDYDPKRYIPAPEPVLAVLMHLVDGADRAASLVGALQAKMDDLWGPDIGLARQYLMRETGSAGAGGE
jgi:hypothetical protein